MRRRKNSDATGVSRAVDDAWTQFVRNSANTLQIPRCQDASRSLSRMSTRSNPRRRVPRRPELAAVGNVALEHHPHVLALRARHANTACVEMWR